MPFIATGKREGPGIAAWYVALLLSSVGLGWVVHHVYSEPLNRALRSRHPLSHTGSASPVGE